MHLQCWRVLFLLFFLHSLSISFPRYKALSIVIKFLVLWSSCLGSFLIHCKNGHEYLIRRIGLVSILLMRFLLQSLVSRSFLVRFVQGILYLFSSFISACLMVSASNIPKYLKFSFSRNVLILSSFGGSMPSLICLFPLFIMSMAHFYMVNSFPLSWL